MSDALRVLARHLELPASYVSEGLVAAREGRYDSWTIPKGDGRVRRIRAPEPELKIVQDAVLRKLLYRAPVSPFAHGFVPGRSIVTNARVHLESAKHLVSLDLADAYPSVSDERVRRTLEWALGPFLKYASPTATRPTRAQIFDLLTELVSFDGSLPQGAPSSGAILNLVCARLDRLIVRFLRAEVSSGVRWKYSRYADDLTFTSLDRSSEGFVDRAIEVILRSGFRVNRRKVRETSTRHGDLVICGVRLHDGELTLERSVLRRYRALFHRVALAEPGEVERAERDLVHGALGHITMVTKACPKLLAGPLEALLARHGEWLRAPGSSLEGPPFPRYGW